MGTVIDLTKDFEKGTLKVALAELPEKMLDSAFEQLDQQAELMKGYAQVYVRVDTGSLRDSIRKERGGIGKNWRVVRVRAGGYIVNPKTGKLVNYATHVEKNYPFMRPAWLMVCHEIEELMRQGVVQAVT